MDALKFLASIAPLDSAIQVSSHGGARIKIDIPESEMPAIVRLMLCRGMPLRITIEHADEPRQEEANNVISWKQGKRKRA